MTVSWPDRPIFGQQLDIESLGVVKRWQSVVEPKSAHLVLIGNDGIEHRHSDGLHELTVTEERNCCGLVVQTAQPSQSYFRASEQRNETLRAWSVAIHRVGGIPVIFDVGEPFTSCGSIPSARLQICEFFDGPLLHGNGGESVARRLRGLVWAAIRGDDNKPGGLRPFICNLPRLFSSLLRHLQLAQIVTWTSGVAGTLSVANKNGAHKSTLRGAEKSGRK